MIEVVVNVPHLALTDYFSNGVEAEIERSLIRNADQVIV